MSERNGPSTDASAANGQMVQEDAELGAAAAYPHHDESWFEPGPKSSEGEQPADGQAWPEPDDGGPRTDWFLRTGRAGLQPDSVTESWEDGGHAAPRLETAGAPPWAGEQPAQVREEPPPWESGPWPGPGEAGPQGRGPRPEPAPRPQAREPERPAEMTNWQATAALAAGILPLVVPGLVFGVLGLRRARLTGIGRAWSWLGIAASAVWAVVLIVFLAGGAGQSGPTCSSYQASVSYPVAQVQRDLSSRAPQTVLAADLRQAVSQANSAAAATSTVSARDAMVALTGALQQALSQVTAKHPTVSDAAISQQLRTQAAAVSAACK
jgi:hypothetical protein